MTVLNKKRDSIPSGAIYIGRGSKWGNPYVLGKDGDRDTVCELHRRLLWSHIKEGVVTIEELAEIHHKPLVCFCAPQRCHGHTLENAAAWAANQLRQKEN